MRAALYARFSTDLQNPASIADQFVACRRHAERMGAVVVGEFQDAAVSGASMANRPGLQALLQAARSGAVDVIVAEALDRLTRSGGDAWDIFDELNACGVRINTISEGAVEEMAIGLKGTMNALFLREVGAKVRRGMSGVIRDGRIATCPYGYQIARKYDAAGEPIRGLREIDEGQAGVVRRIFAEYLAGSSPNAIAARLNAEGQPGPKGGHWSASSIIGRGGQTSGLLRNQLYIGQIVWGRRTYTKDRRTGKHRSRTADPGQVVQKAAPELRIVDDETWAGVQARLEATAARVKAAGNASAANRPKRLLTGLLRCGVCGGAMATAGPNRNYRCAARIQKGLAVCTNGRTAPAEKIEAEVLAIVRRDLLHPDVIDAAVREYHAIQKAKDAASRSRRAELTRELAEVQRRAERLVDQVADGVLSGRAVRDRLAKLETRQTELEAELAAEPTAEVYRLIPSAGGKYRQLVEDLQAKLTGENIAERDAAREALRQVVRSVRFFPGEKRGEWSVDLDADLTALLKMAPKATAPLRRTGSE